VLKVLSRNAGIKRLDMKENLLSLHMSEAHQRQPFKIVELIQRRPKQYQLTPDHILKIKFLKGFLSGGWDPVKKVLKEIHQHVNN
jgi:transcription-repair coupling factor (superfamily II helicase)